jgi:hypothetical protein
MLHKVRIRLSSPLLGDKQTRERVRRFSTAEGFLMLDQAHWFWACREAVTALHLDEVESETIHQPSKMLVPTIHLYNHRYRSATGRQQQEMFESVNSNYVLTFYLLVTSPEVGTTSTKRPPTLEELHKVLDLVGEHIGISPWGNKFGFGRFKVLEVNEL